MITRETNLVYIVEDNPLYAEYCKQILQQVWNCETKHFSTGEALLSGLEEEPDLIIVDYHLDSIDPDAMTGEQLLTELQEKNIKSAVIFQSYEQDLHLAVDLVRKGAIDYVVKDDDYQIYLEKLILQFIQLKKTYEEIGMHKEKVKKETIRVTLVVMIFMLSLGLLFSL